MGEHHKDDAVTDAFWWIWGDLLDGKKAQASRHLGRAQQASPMQLRRGGDQRVQYHAGGGGGIPSEGGPPLGLGWDVVNQSHTSLADFELTRIGVRSPREVYMSEGFLSARQRSRILKQVGHTKKEIKKATRKVEELVTARWELNTVRADNWLFDTQSAESAL